MASKSSSPKSAQTASQGKGSGSKGSIVPFANLTTPPSLDSMEKIMSTSKNNFDKFKTDASTSGRQGMEACMKSGTMLKQGMETYFKTVYSLAQSAAERQSEAMKQLMACKTLTEMTECQNKMAQDNFEDMMQGVSKLSEISIKIATDVFEPINEEVSKNVKKATDSAAA